MKPKSQIAILKTIVKWQAQEIEALQELVKAATELTNIREEQLRDELARVEHLETDRNVLQGQLEALERGPEWQRIGHTGFSWDWQCRDCQATMFQGHTLDCVHSGYLRIEDVTLEAQPKFGVRDFFVDHPEALEHMMEGIAKGVKREVRKYERGQAQWSKPMATRAIAWEECGR